MSLTSNLNILILHAHWNNRGDEAAIRAMIDSLQSNLGITNIDMMVSSGKVSQFPYAEINLLNMYPSTIISYIDSLLCLFTLGRFSLTTYGKKYLACLKKSDIVIHAPGGPSIGDMYGGKLRDYPYLCRLLIVVFYGKPLFFYSPLVVSSLSKGL
ncbi:MAG: hypothetical protein A4E23_00304 [Methanomethylovorans sp. PtaU1.Bin073]|nr:MAG: hypothetical protein A4E23_00304 [Methanomethylovorans sp. PtaU1.Bin073]